VTRAASWGCSYLAALQLRLLLARDERVVRHADCDLTWAQRMAARQSRRVLTVQILWREAWVVAATYHGRRARHGRRYAFARSLPLAGDPAAPSQAGGRRKAQFVRATPGSCLKRGLGGLHLYHGRLRIAKACSSVGVGCA
jgi:hypothetical protein